MRASVVYCSPCALQHLLELRSRMWFSSSAGPTSVRTHRAHPTMPEYKPGAMHSHLMIPNVLDTQVSNFPFSLVAGGRLATSRSHTRQAAAAARQPPRNPGQPDTREAAHLKAAAPSTGHDANAGSVAQSWASSARHCSAASCAPAGSPPPPPPAAAAVRAPRRRASGSSSAAQKPRRAPATCWRSSGSSHARPSARPSSACAAAASRVRPYCIP